MNGPKADRRAGWKQELRSLVLPTRPPPPAGTAFPPLPPVPRLSLSCVQTLTRRPPTAPPLFHISSVLASLPGLLSRAFTRDCELSGPELSSTFSLLQHRCLLPLLSFLSMEVLCTQWAPNKCYLFSLQSPLNIALLLPLPRLNLSQNLVTGEDNVPLCISMVYPPPTRHPGPQVP